MTQNKLKMGKGAVVTELCHIIHLYKHVRKKYPNIERGQRLKNSVVLRRKLKKIRKNWAGCIIFTNQDLHDGNALIELYTIE